MLLNRGVHSYPAQGEGVMGNAHQGSLYLPFPEEGKAQNCPTVGSQGVAHTCHSVHTIPLPSDQDNEKGLEPCYSFSLRK